MSRTRALAGRANDPEVPASNIQGRGHSERQVVEIAEELCRMD